MTSAIAAAVRRALHLGRTASHYSVHFHMDASGRPYVGDFHRCDSPGLSSREMGLS
jgi:hypothetical protein